MHVMFPEDVRNLVTKNYYSDPVYAPDLDLIKRNNNENVKRWPQLRNIKSGSSYIDRTCLLLLLAAGITNIESVDEKTQETVNIILRKAWRFISENILTDVKENIDYNTATYKGYKLDILDKDKVRFALVEKAVVCPMTNQFLNCTFHNISPLVKGKLDPNTLNRYSVKTPFTDIPLQKSKREFTKGGVFDNEKWRVYFDNWFEAEYEPVMQKLSGGFNMQRNIFMQRDIFLAAEHSGQIDGSVLRESERKFEDGKLNILSCSTTMEMGVDIGGISVVVMKNIPPKPANYLQRAGRAGRRKETQSLALTFCNDTPIGNTVLKNPKWALDHDIASPAMNFRSRTILKRHINALLLGEIGRAHV